MRRRSIPQSEHTVIVNWAASEVFGFVTDMDNFARSEGGVLESEMTSQGPMGVGSTGRVVRRIPVTVEVTFEVTEYEPDTRYAARTTSGPTDVQGNYSFEPLEAGARVHLVYSGRPLGLPRLLEPLMRPMVEQQRKEGFGRLKRILER